MLSNGQMIFGISFAVVFIAVMIYAYRKDLKLHRRHYKGSVWILIAFIAFILILSAVKYFFA